MCLNQVDHVFKPGLLLLMFVYCCCCCCCGCCGGGCCSRSCSRCCCCCCCCSCSCCFCSCSCCCFFFFLLVHYYYYYYYYFFFFFFFLFFIFRSLSSSRPSFLGMSTFAPSFSHILLSCLALLPILPGSLCPSLPRAPLSMFLHSLPLLPYLFPFYHSALACCALS